MGLIKDALMFKVCLGINAKEPRNKGVITAIQGPKLINNPLLHFFLVDGQIMRPRVTPKRKMRMQKKVLERRENF